MEIGIWSQLLLIPNKVCGRSWGGFRTTPPLSCPLPFPDTSGPKCCGNGNWRGSDCCYCCYSPATIVTCKRLTPDFPLMFLLWKKWWLAAKLHSNRAASHHVATLCYTPDSDFNQAAFNFLKTHLSTSSREKPKQPKHSVSVWKITRISRFNCLRSRKMQKFEDFKAPPAFCGDLETVAEVSLC